MAKACALLAMPPANPAAAESVDGFMQRVAGIDITHSPHFASGRWVTMGWQAPLRSSHNCGSGSGAGDASQISLTRRGPP